MTVRYADAAHGRSNVRLVAVWNRGDLTEMDMSNSSGPKDQIRNAVFAIFERCPQVKRVAILCTPLGPPFSVLQSYDRIWRDGAGKQVIIKRETGEAPGVQFIG